mgnify:CR=1 FL=1
MISNATLRQNARSQLGANIFGNTWIILGVVSFLYSAAIGALASTVVGVILLGGPLTYGLYRLLISTVNYKKVDLNDVASGVTEAFANSIVLYFLQTLFTMLWSLLFVIPGIVKSYSYAMAMYIQQDDPSKEGRECIEESRLMMDGHKWQLFCLDCSFIGWYLLGALCLGVGIFFVLPYHQLARTNFYLALKAEKENDYQVITE